MTHAFTTTDSTFSFGGQTWKRFPEEASKDIVMEYDDFVYVKLKIPTRDIFIKSEDTITVNGVALTGSFTSKISSLKTTVIYGQIAQSLPYLFYSVMINAIGTSNPQIVSYIGEDDSNTGPFINTLGGEVVWTRVEQGLYRGTLAGKFKSGKTQVFNSSGSIDKRIVGYVGNEDYVEFYQVNVSDGLPADGFIQLNVEIKVN